MKKFLSLVLALVMTMSLVTVSAGAKDFADDSSINYKAAVDVISELGVVDGYSDNSFRPDNLLTRGAAAKIICNLILGPTTANALSAGTAPFKDVPTTNVFAGYIAYCAQKGIISGYGDGTFRPTGTLSGNAFMKMLLGALGYDSSIEGYTGANWQVNVIKQASGIGLDDGNDSFVGNNPVTRGEAALYAYNMLQATMVEYDQKNTIVVGDIEINTSSSRKDVANNATVETIDNDNKMQFAEMYFGDLRKSTGDSDEFNRPATTWRLKSKTIGTYAETPDLTYTAEVKTGDIYSDLGLTSGIAAAKVTGYRNGSSSDFTTEGWNKNIVRGGTDKIGGNGALTEVWYDDDADAVTISVIDTYAGEVTATYAATSARDAYVTVTGKTGAPSGDFETTEFSVDDIVTFNYSKKSGDDGVYNVAPAETVTGELTGYTEKKSVSVGGNTYSGSYYYKDNILNTNLGSYKTYDVTLVLDPYGYVAYIDTSNASSNYAVITNITKSGGTYGTDGIATLLMTDGKTVEVKLTEATKAKIGTGTKQLMIGDIVRYSVSSSDKYDLELLADVDTASPAGVVAKNGQSTLNNLKAGIYDSGFKGTATVANGKTTFLVKTMNGSDAEYTAYTGIANVPDITILGGKTASVAVFCKNGSIATVVYIDATDTSAVTVSNSNSDVIFVKGVTSPSQSYDGTVIYYEYTAIVNGEIVNNFKAKNVINSDSLWSTVSYDKNGVATLSGQLTATNYNDILTAKGGTATVTVRAEDGVIGLGSNYYTYTDDVQVFFKNSDGDITRSSIGAIGTDSDDEAYFKLTDGEISTLVVVQKGVGTGGVGSSYTFTALTDSMMNYRSSILNVDLRNLGLNKGGTVANLNDLTLTATVYGLNTNMSWVQVATGSNTDVDLVSGNTSALTQITGLGLTSGSYRVTLTLTGGDVGTLNLGTFSLNA